MKLDRRHVRDFKQYAAGDVESFELWFELLHSLGYSLDMHRGKISQVIPSFDKFAWRASDTVMRSFDSRKPSIPAYELAHQSMHTLLACRYGDEYRARPRLTLLSEALAGAVGVYFELARIAARGFDTDSFEFKAFCRNARSLKLPIKRLIRQGVRDPFLAFKRATLAELQVADLLLECARDTRKHRLTLKHISSIDHAAFVIHKDYGNFLIFLLAYCGTESNAEDQAYYKECLSILDSSSSMIDFQRKLGIDDFIARGRPALGAAG
jgi:hypothetical protein